MEALLKIMSIFRILLLSAALFYGFVASCFAMEVKLQWDPNPETGRDLAGYKIHYDTDPDPPFSNVVDIPMGTIGFDENNPEYTITGLDENEIYFFVVTAYDNETPILESGYSSSVAKATTPEDTPVPLNVISRETVDPWTVLFLNEPSNGVAEANPGDEAMVTLTVNPVNDPPWRIMTPMA